MRMSKLFLVVIFCITSRYGLSEGLDINVLGKFRDVLIIEIFNNTSNTYLINEGKPWSASNDTMANIVVGLLPTEAPVFQSFPSYRSELTFIRILPRSKRTMTFSLDSALNASNAEFDLEIILEYTENPNGYLIQDGIHAISLLKVCCIESLDLHYVHIKMKVTPDDIVVESLADTVQSKYCKDYDAKKLRKDKLFNFYFRRSPWVSISSE